MLSSSSLSSSSSSSSTTTKPSMSTKSSSSSSSSSSWLRKVWIGLAAYLSFGPIMMLLPLLGTLGGFVKMGCVTGAGPLFSLHSFLLLSYLGLHALNFLSYDELRTPALISLGAAIALPVPPLLTLFTCSASFRNDVTSSRTETTSGGRVFDWLFRRDDGVDVAEVFSKWSGPPIMCPDLTEYTNNITSVYKRLDDHGQSVGPYIDQEPTYLNTMTKVVFDGVCPTDRCVPLKELSTYYFPSPSKNKKKKNGLLISIHGGGWYTGGPLMGFPMSCDVQHAHSIEGWDAATISYRLGKDGWSGVTQISDVKEAINHLIDTYTSEIDPTRIVLVGSSAGAHLALLAGYQFNNEWAKDNGLKKRRIAGVLATSPYTSIKVGLGPHAITKYTGTWDESEATRRLCQGITNDSGDDDESMLEECHKVLSPTEHLTKHSPPTILVHAGNDEYYTKQHSRELELRLKELGTVPYVYMEPPMMQHAFEVLETAVPTQLYRHAMIKFLKSI